MVIYQLFFKRAIDFFASLLGLIIAFPALVILAFLLTLSNHWTPFFIQPRPGKNNRIFKLVKFKTMNDKRDATGKLLPDRERLTRVGKFIRSTSMDELPQLINVLKGDMSLIGPRPLLVCYLPLYSKEQARRHEVRPGITGWAQVNGRNSLTWEEKFKLDVWYVDNISFTLDIKILWLTVVKVFKREGIIKPGQATMDSFKGNTSQKS